MSIQRREARATRHRYLIVRVRVQRTVYSQGGNTRVLRDESRTASLQMARVEQDLQQHNKR